MTTISSAINSVINAVTGSNPSTAANASTAAPVTSAVTSAPSSSAGSGAASSVVGQQTIAGNFNTFLQLLTTQLQNQNPLDPLDTNQFTQQLVEFAGVEQQINTNTSLGTLIKMQQATQASMALNFVGSTVVVNGSTAPLSGGKATWSFSPDKPQTANISIANSSGQVVFTDSRTVNAGTQSYTWNGQGSNGQQMPPGNYTISITGTDASGQTAAIATDMQGTVSSVDLTQSPPVLNVGSQSFTLDKVKQILGRS